MRAVEPSKSGTVERDGLQIGYEHTFVHQVADFLDAAAAGKPCPPTFRDALETTRICDAVLNSAKKKEIVLAKP